MQHDMKRLLAYHSIENIGIILMGLGLSMIFLGNGHIMLGTLGLVAALYHTLNHALFKALLFLGAGAVLYRTHAHDLDQMGGLIHRNAGHRAALPHRLRGRSRRCRRLTASCPNG